MLMDKESEHNRMFALNMIKKIREGPGPIMERGKTIRSFKTPLVNWDAETLEELIDWGKEPLTEPPITIGTPIAVLEQQALFGEGLEFPVVPCHAQAVERMVKLVTKASDKVKSYKRRHQEILCKLYENSQKKAKKAGRLILGKANSRTATKTLKRRK